MRILCSHSGPHNKTHKAHTKGSTKKNNDCTQERCNKTPRNANEMLTFGQAPARFKTFQPWQRLGRNFQILRPSRPNDKKTPAHTKITQKKPRPTYKAHAKRQGRARQNHAIQITQHTNTSFPTHQNVPNSKRDRHLRTTVVI